MNYSIKEVKTVPVGQRVSRRSLPAFAQSGKNDGLKGARGDAQSLVSPKVNLSIEWQGTSAAGADETRPQKPSFFPAYCARSSLQTRLKPMPSLLKMWKL